MNKLKQYAKTTLCMALSAAMLFMDMGVSVSAVEISASEVQEQTAAEMPEEISETTEPESEMPETAFTEQTDSTEPASTEEIVTQETQTETASSEEAVTEADIKPDTAEEAATEETLTEENEAETEAETAESIQNLTFSNTDIDHGEYKEDGNDITWVIDKNGKLTVEGTGDFKGQSWQPWDNNCEKIISAEIKVTGMKDASGMFFGCSNLTSIDVSKFDTGNVTNMMCMFDGCSSLTNLDVSGFDTSKVTDMSQMFDGCSSLTSLDVSGFDTSKVTDMGEMFSGCSSLTSLDVSGFDTSKVTDMRHMFNNCSSLISLNVSGFDTSNVWSMYSMFSGCTSLISLDVSDFDISNVGDMSYMFRDCSSLISLDVSGFDTSKVGNMAYMFDGCTSLASLDVSGFATGNVARMEFMFDDCTSLTSLDVSGFNTSKATDMSWMFRGCSSLTSIDVSGFNTSNVTNMYNMFAGCSSLTNLDVSGFDTSNVTNMNSMFSTVKATSIDVSGFDTSNVTNMGYMFSSCNELTSLDVSGFDTSNVTDMYNMFNRCSKIVSIDVSSFDTSNVTDMHGMFDECSNLVSIDLSSFDAGKVTNAEYILDLCENLVTVYTPYNLKVSSGSLRKSYLDTAPVWYKPDGTTLTELPQNLDYSILIKRNEVPKVSSASITAKKAKTAYTVGEAMTTDDITVMYYSTDGTVKKLTSGFTTNAADIDMSTPGRKTLEITYSDNGSDFKADIDLYVSITLTQNDIIITLPEETYVYDGTPKKPVPTVTLKSDNTPLVEGTDYKVSYKDNINAGWSAAVVITGQNNYQGTFTKNFTINKAAAPEAQQMEVQVASCATAQQGRTADLSGCFTGFGSITYYSVKECREDDAISGNVLAGNPTAWYGLLTYDTNAGAAGDFVTVTIEVSFANYENSTLTVIIRMTDAQAVTISQIKIRNSVYTGKAVSYSGTARVKLEDGTDVTDKVALTYTYSGRQADNSIYAATAEAPVNAGSYKLTVAVAQDDKNYTGSAEYSFTIAKVPLTVTARDMALKIGDSIPKAEDYIYDTKGLLAGDSLTTKPTLTCDIADTANAGTYVITVSGADAGMNYAVTHQNGTLTVSETGETVEYYTVTFNLNGHGTNITPTSVKAGSLIEKPADPKADGYTFTGWYTDSACTKKWDFAKDTAEADTTLYAGWTKNSTAGGDDENERTDLETVNGTIAAIKAKVYDQNAYEPVVKVTVTEGKKKITLTEGADYSVIYQDNTDAGEGKVIVEGNGIYKGQIEKPFTISPKPVKKLKVLTGGIVGTATKQAASGAVYVYDGTKRLVENVDYELSDVQPVKNKTDVVQVTVNGKKTGNYDGEVTAKITVYESGTDLSKLITPDNVTLVPESNAKSAAKANQEAYAYTGKAVKPAVTVTIGGAALTDKDYKVQYQNNKDAGTAYVVVTGKGAYKGNAVVPFTIKAETVASPNDFTIKEIKAATYNGKLQKPAVKVTIQKNGKWKNLSKKDYTVSYEYNFHAGTATIIITGKGNYAGLNTTKTFTINPQQIKKASLKGTQGSLELYYNKRKLKEGTDYETPVYGAENKGKVEVTITGKAGGDFTGTLVKKVKTQ